jgi:hypothetical protein
MTSKLSKLSHGTSAEEVVPIIRRENFIGIFKVMLTQTQNHPDQRALDQDWVDQLVQLIGNMETLNRALNPISVVLLNDDRLGELQKLCKEHPGVPMLPEDVVVEVISGQHRLAMLSQLGLEDRDELWWHAEVYKKGVGLSNTKEQHGHY